MTLMEAYEVAAQRVEAERLANEPASSVGKSGFFNDKNNQARRIPNSAPTEHRGLPPVPVENPLPGLGGKICTTHREKQFTFSDGTVWKCCTADGCTWGQPIGNRFRVKHSDGVRGGTIYTPDFLDEEDTSVEELSVPTFTKPAAAVVAGAEADEGDESNEEDIATERAIEQAAQEGDDYGDEGD